MKVFLTGASGFIGGAVASALVRDGHEVRGLVRDPAKVEGVRKSGVTPVRGDLDDAALLEAEARSADAVINAASSDHLGAVEALLKGLEGSGKPFLHTSGSSIVGDEAMGEPSDRIFQEGAPFDPEPDKRARVALDRRVLEARNVRSVVLCNTLIYGHSAGSSAESVQIPRLVKQARDSGVSRYIGRGLNRWSNVHIEDVAELYVLALTKAKPGTFLFVESGEESFENIGDAIATRLKLGPAESWSAENAISKWGRELAVFALGSNSRVRGKIGRELGWQPKHGSVREWILTQL